MKRMASLILAILVGLLLCACGSNAETAQTTEPTEKVVSKEEMLQSAEEIPLVQINDDTFDNIVKAKQLYCGKVIKLSGIVYQIQEGRVILRAEEHNTLGKAGIAVSLSDEELMLLGKGQKIDVVGQISDDTENYVNIANFNYESTFFLMTQAYVVQDRYEVTGELGGANTSFEPSYDFAIGGSNFYNRVYFAENVDTSGIDMNKDVITVEGKLIYDGDSIYVVEDATIVAKGQ